MAWLRARRGAQAVTKLTALAELGLMGNRMMGVPVRRRTGLGAQPAGSPPATRVGPRGRRRIPCGVVTAGAGPEPEGVSRGVDACHPRPLVALVSLDKNDRAAHTRNPRGGPDCGPTAGLSTFWPGSHNLGEPVCESRVARTG
jgi:hypothetical protein